jgi:hypothetical protein
MNETEVQPIGYVPKGLVRQRLFVPRLIFVGMAYLMKE